MAWTNDPKATDALGFDEAHYDGMDKLRLEAYMHVALKFDKDGIEGAPLAKHRIRVRLDAIRDKERALAEAKAAARAKLLADDSWKERDTWHRGRSNLLYVQEGGYKQYTDALLNEKERDGNRGSPIKGPIQETLIGEIYYMSGRRVRGNYRGDEAIATIKERYGLPCWGALEAKGRMEFRRVLSGIRGDEHSAVKHRFQTLHPEAAAAEEWWKTPEWKAVSHYPFNTLMNSWTSRTLGDRDWFEYWMDEGQTAALLATEAGGHDSLKEGWHTAIKGLWDAIPQRVIDARKAAQQALDEAAAAGPEEEQPLPAAEADQVDDEIDVQQAAEAAAAVEAEEAGEAQPETPDVDDADAKLLAMIDTAIKFHEVKTKSQRHIDQWNLIREAIVAGESSPALKRRVARAAGGARPGGKFYELWVGVRNRISELPDPAP